MLLRSCLSLSTRSRTLYSTTTPFTSRPTYLPPYPPPPPPTPQNGTADLAKDTLGAANPADLFELDADDVGQLGLKVLPSLLSVFFGACEKRKQDA